MTSPDHQLRWLPAGHPDLGPSDDPRRAVRRLTMTIGTDPRLVRRRNLVLGLLERHGSSLAHRDHPVAHLTSSALVLDAERRRLVVLLHAKLGRWLQPGGHADGDLELAGVAMREATEETGLAGLVILDAPVDVDVHRVDHGDALGGHLHLDVRFVAVAPSSAMLQGNHESDDLRWVAPEELHELTDEPSLHRLARVGCAAASAWAGTA